MSGNISPEERLLHLIKGKQLPNEEAAVAAQDASSPKEEDVSQTAQPKLISKQKQKTRNSYLLINIALVGILFVILIFMGLGYIYPFSPKIKIPDRVSANTQTREQMETSVAERPALSYYTNSVGKRQIFKIFQPPKPKAKAPDKPKVTLQQRLAGYTFVGILFGDTPQAIVEDKKSARSHYVSAGQMLGEIKIESIERGKVTVSCEEETMDINI